MLQRVRRVEQRPAFRGYVSTLRDRILSPERQAFMRGRSPVEAHVELDTDHSPFLSCPARLVTALDAMVSEAA